MKMLGEERLLRASQIVFIESLPQEKRLQFSKIHFDETLDKDKQLEECAKIAATLPDKSKRFFEHIKRQQLKFEEERKARVSSGSLGDKADKDMELLYFKNLTTRFFLSCS